MKKRTLVKRLSAVVLAGMMTAAMGMTSLADETPAGNTGVATGTSIPVTKTVTTDGDTYAPNTSFTIAVETAGAGNYDGNVVYEGVTDGLIGTTISFVPGDSTKPSYSQSGTLTADASKFSKPGVYHYTVKEKAGSYEGIVYDSTSYDVYVYVYNNSDGNGLSVGNIVSVKNGAKVALDFTNDYGAGENNDSTHDVTIKKSIEGDQADLNATFTFTVAVNGATGEKYKVVVTKDGVTTTTSVESGKSIDVTGIGHNDTITIYGLTEGDTYTVTEKEANEDGYVTTVDNSTEKTGEVTGSATADKTEHTVHNTKNAVTPTGIVMSIAPYILLVALAGVLAVLFLRRRREEF